jgi:hypothetical protein
MTPLRNLHPRHALQVELLERARLVLLLVCVGVLQRASHLVLLHVYPRVVEHACLAMLHARLRVRAELCWLLLPLVVLHVLLLLRTVPQAHTYSALPVWRNRLLTNTLSNS